jgi:uncharacterized protein YabE (DUF348 family)
MLTPKKRLLIIGIPTVILAIVILAIILTRKQIVINIDGEETTYNTNALTVKRLLLVADIPLGEVDLISPELNHWLRDRDQISIQRASQIQIHYDGKVHSLLTPERTPVILLAKAGVGLGLDDKILADGKPIGLDQPLPPSPAHSLQVHRATPITLEDGSQEYGFASTASTLGEALWEQGIRLFHSDQLNPPSDTPLRGEEIKASLQRSQELTIALQGQTYHTRSIGPTVGAALADTGIALQGSDYSQPVERSCQKMVKSM